MKKIAIIIIAIILSLGLFNFLKNPNFFNKSSGKSLIKLVPEKTSYNFLLLGYGGGNHDGTYLTDTIMIAHVNIKSKKVNLISIPRDLWVKLPTKSGEDFHTKINAVYQLELFPKDFPDLKPVSTKKILSEVSGLPIDGYLSVNFAGFTKSVDILGGIDVEVLKSFTDSEYPIDGKEKELCGQDTEALFKKAEPFITPGYNPEDRIRQFKDDSKLEEFVKNATESPELAFPCRYEKLEFQKGITHIDGKTALKYARSRHSQTEGGDFNRANRQQQVILAIKNKVLSLGFLTKIIPLMQEYKNDVKTDISLDIVQKLISQADKTSDFKIITFVINDENVLKDAISDDKQFILIPEEGIDNWLGIHKAILNTINGATLTPSASSSANLK